jgi:hypothetical protein
LGSGSLIEHLARPHDSPQPALLALFEKYRNHKGDQAKLKSPQQLLEVRVLFLSHQLNIAPLGPAMLTTATVAAVIVKAEFALASDTSQSVYGCQEACLLLALCTSPSP